MIKAKNQKVIARLSRKSLRANRTRNIMAVLAIALTTLMFTALLTIAGTIVNSYQQATFRQVGGDFHGTFKDVTAEEMRALSADELVVEAGARLMLGMPSDPPFNKAHVEVSYMDLSCARGYFCTPEEGALPAEGTDQLACDTRILKLLGVEPAIGARLTLPYYLGGNTGSPQLVADTFTLSGWWTYDPASVASMAVVPLSYAERVLAGYEPVGHDDVTGRWDLNIYLAGSAHIEQDLDAILERHGYQSHDSQADHYIATGVNWAYLGAQFSGNVDAGTAAAMAGLLLLIIFTGYLIIYNIFQISVTNDIRFYGLLKTIGATGRQIRRLILRQALLLSAIGIPLGLALGYLCGNVLAPVVMSTLSYKNTFASAHPLIFIGAAAFAVVTVLISCRRPGKVAGRVSPVEAVRYTENSGAAPSRPRSSRRASVYRMARANLGRNRRKTVLVVISLALAVVLLQVTCTFARGFDMDKYLRHWVVSDFIVGHADYFQSFGGFSSADTAVPAEVVAAVEAQGGVTASGRIYGATGGVEEFITEERYRQWHGRWNDAATVEQILARQERTADGRVATIAQLYGMEAYPLDQLTVVDGDLAALYDPGQNAIAAVYRTDDYDNLEDSSNWARVGDQVTLRYVERWEYYDPHTGEVVTDGDRIDRESLPYRAAEYREATYTVAAAVTMRNAMSYRYLTSDQFALNAEVFKRDTQSDHTMIYLFDTAAESNAAMEAFLADYTENAEPTMDYESKQSYRDEFDSFRNMFLLLGGVLSAIIGLVGVLNFLNAVLTSIITRRREFAMLQSIGMTGRQLKTMLVCEGVFYSLLAVGLSLALSLIAGPLLDTALSSMFWFFTYRFTLLPVLVVTPIFLLLGVLLPLLAYRFAARQSIVERLREAE